MEMKGEWHLHFCERNVFVKDFFSFYIIKREKGMKYAFIRWKSFCWWYTWEDDSFKEVFSCHAPHQKKLLMMDLFIIHLKLIALEITLNLLLERGCVVWRKNFRFQSITNNGHFRKWFCNLWFAMLNILTPKCLSDLCVLSCSPTSDFAIAFYVIWFVNNSASYSILFSKS